MVLLRERTRPGLGIIEPCPTSPAKTPPSGPGWIHEIKLDGIRVLALAAPPSRKSKKLARRTVARVAFEHRPQSALREGRRGCVSRGLQPGLREVRSPKPPPTISISAFKGRGDVVQRNAWQSALVRRDIGTCTRRHLRLCPPVLVPTAPGDLCS